MFVAVKDNDNILVGLNQSLHMEDISEKDLTLDENIPFFKVAGTNDCYVFASVLDFASDLIRYNSHIFKNVTDGNSLMREVVPKLKELLSKYSLILDDKTWDNQLLVIKGNKMFQIRKSFLVTEIDSYTATNFEHTMISALEETKELDLTKRFLTSINIVSRLKNVNLFPIVLFDTKLKKKKVIYK